MTVLNSQNVTAWASSTDASTYASGTFTPTSPGRICYILFCHNQSAGGIGDATSITGNSITNVQKVVTQGHSTVASPTKKVELWVATTTATAGAITVAIPGTPTGCQGVLLEMGQVFPSQGTYPGIVQYATAVTDASPTLWSIPLLRPCASPDNAVVAIFSSGAATTHTVKTGWTDLRDAALTLPSHGFQVEWLNRADPNPQATPSSGGDFGGIAFEVASAPVRSPVIDTTLLQPPGTKGLQLPIVGPPLFAPRPAAATGDQTIALSPATITVTAQADAVTTGAVTAALSPATITVTAQAHGRTATNSLTLSPATVTLEAQRLPFLFRGVGKLATLIDTFASFASPWDSAIDSNTSVVGGQLVVGSVNGYTDGGATASDDGFQLRQDVWDFTNSQILCEFLPVAGTTDGPYDFYVYDAAGALNHAKFRVTGGNLIASTTGWGSNTTLASVAYNATTHRWLRLTLAGTTLTFATSPDSTTWTTFATDTLSAGDLVQAARVIPVFANNASTNLVVDNVNFPTGPQTIALSPATITVTAQALANIPPNVLALSPATITVTPQAHGSTYGGTTVALSPATVTVTAQRFRFLGETDAVVTEPTGAGGKYDVSRATRAQWRKEREQYELQREFQELLEREDEELLVIL